MLSRSDLQGSQLIERNDLSIYEKVDSWWDSRDDFFAPLRRLVPARMDYITRRAPLFGRRVLDVGCGGGYMSEALARSGARVTGVDIASGAIEAGRVRAQAEGLAIDFRTADAQALPFADASFDVVVCTDVLVHVPDPALVVAELCRVVKPGGTIFFSAINRTWLSRLVMINLGEDLLGWVPKGTHDPGKFISPNRLKEWFSAHGAPVLDRQGLGPVGWSAGLVFGSHPTSAVMYQGHAQRTVTTFAPLPNTRK